MLIKGLLDLIYGILNIVLFTELPGMPEFVLTLLDEVTSYLDMGVSVLRSFVGAVGINILSMSIILIFSLHGFLQA